MPVSQDDPRLKRVGFAKLVGENVDHIMRKYEIVLGRRSKATALDVVLGDMMSVSRQHAKIFYNFESKQFELEVLGKNGVVVDGVLHEPGATNVVLKSRAFLQIGTEVSFYFLLPKKLSKMFRVPKRKREDPATEEQEGRDASEDTQPIAQPPIDQQAEQSKPTPPPQSAAAAPAPAPVSAPAAAPAPFALKSPQTIIVPTTSIHQPAQALPQHPIVGMNPAMSAAPAMLPGHQMMPPRGQVNPMALHQMQMLQQYQQMQQIHQLHQMQALQGHSPSALQHALLHHQQLQQQQQQQQGMPVLQQVGPGGHAVRPAFYPGTLPHQGQAHPPGSAPGN